MEEADDEVDEPRMARSGQGSAPARLCNVVAGRRPGRRKEPSSSEADDVSVVQVTRQV